MKKNTKAKKTTTKPKEKQEEDFYTPEEERRLDKFHEQTENIFEDDEIYELMLKYKDDDEAILKELNEQLKERKRGGNYQWQDIGKRNYIFYFIIFY
jgi:hypothetical protein